MPADTVFLDPEVFAATLRELRLQRRSRVRAGRKVRGRRAALTRAKRGEVLRKTGGRCHICGGIIDGNDWQADHVMAYSSGGKHAANNYLPAHSICNNYRWHYDAEEFQWILKLGVWVRLQIEHRTSVGRAASKRFCQYDRRRVTRRNKVKTESAA